MQRRRAAAEGLESSYRRHGGGEEAAYADDVRCLHGLEVLVLLIDLWLGGWGVIAVVLLGGI